MQNVLAYFAYGSNLNLKQMKDRCPGSKPLIPATLKGYRLTERKCADIDPSPGSSVHGVMCHLTKEDLDNLDVYEGYPRQTVCAEGVGGAGEDADGMMIGRY